MDANNIGIFLSELRKKENLMQKDIANLCSVSVQAVSKWERGESIPDIQLLEKLSILYKISINELINGERAETYVDIEKRTNYITMTTAILVFFSYLLNFVKIPIVQDFYTGEIILKGYQVIFEGTSGFYIYISWIQFLILFSHLILQIFIINKVVKKTEKLNLYIQRSAIVVILVSIIGLLGGIYFIFPHFIITSAMIVTLYLTGFKFDTKGVFKKFDIKGVFKKFDKTKRKAPRHLKLTSYLLLLLNTGLAAMVLNYVIPDIQRNYLYHKYDFTNEQVDFYIGFTALYILVNLYLLIKMNINDQKRVFNRIGIINIIQPLVLIILKAYTSFGTSIYLYTGGIVLISSLLLYGNLKEQV